MTRTLINDSLGIIAWMRNPGRLMDLGRVFCTQPKIISFPRLRSRWSAPLRYVFSTVLTITWLLRMRPRVVIVTSPPPFASALVAIYARVFNATFILDAHPGAFGHRDRFWSLFVPLQKILVRRASVTLVTEPSLGATVREWGGKPLVFHEAPPPHQPIRPSSNITARPSVVFTTIFDPDEPLDAIIAAACHLTGCDVAITGDHSRLAHALRRKLLAAPHISLTGWLDQAHYLALIASADVVVALTCDPHSVMRSAFEAVYLERPTVLSDTTTLRICFSPSVFVENSATAIVRGVHSVLADYQLWVERIRPRHDILLERWTQQRAALELAILDATNKLGHHASVSADG